MYNLSIKKKQINRDFIKWEYLEKKKKNIVIVCPKFYGKTTLLKQYVSEINNKKESLEVYVDLEKISLSPESFSVEFITYIASYFFGQYNQYDANLSNIEQLFAQKNKFGKSAVFIEQIHNELHKIIPNQILIIESAFNFANSLSKKVIICLDEFYELTGLNNYGQIKDFIGLFFSLHLQNVQFIIAGSDVSFLKEIFSKTKDYEIIELQPFSQKEIQELLKEIVVDDKIIDEICFFSKGIPYYAYTIASKYKEIKDVKQAFLMETLSKDGKIYSSCLDILNLSLAKTRGQTLSRTILKVLAFNKELRLNEISRKIFRSSPVTKTLLTRLMSAGLIEKKGNLFSYSDSILRYWAKYYFSGIEFDADKKDEYGVEL